jgi:septal ring factor EnvC (AmiA/AmiB activator)
MCKKIMDQSTKILSQILKNLQDLNVKTGNIETSQEFIQKDNEHTKKEITEIKKIQNGTDIKLNKLNIKIDNVDERLKKFEDIFSSTGVLRGLDYVERHIKEEENLQDTLSKDYGQGEYPGRELLPEIFTDKANQKDNRRLMKNTLIQNIFSSINVWKILGKLVQVILITFAVIIIIIILLPYVPWLKPLLAFIKNFK